MNPYKQPKSAFKLICGNSGILNQKLLQNFKQTRNPFAITSPHSEKWH